MTNLNKIGVAIESDIVCAFLSRDVEAASVGPYAANMRDSFVMVEAVRLSNAGNLACHSGMPPLFEVGRAA
jgi:hypothetical protein